MGQSVMSLGWNFGEDILSKSGWNLDSKDPQIQKLYDILNEHFYVEGKQETSVEEEEAEEEQCQMEAAESDIDDYDLASELGAVLPPKSPPASSTTEGSSESLHTGLTGELETKLQISKPEDSKPLAPVLCTPVKKQEKKCIMVEESPPPKAQPPKAFKPDDDDAAKRKRIEELRPGIGE